MIRVNIGCVNGDGVAFYAIDGDLNQKKEAAYQFLREHEHEGMDLSVLLFEDKNNSQPSKRLDFEEAYQYLADHTPSEWSERATIERDLKKFMERALYDMSLDELKETMYLIIARNEEPIAHELYYEPNEGHVIMVQRDLGLEVEEVVN